ncbi:hypothetical protein BDD43_2306 [Mucilaginibacter gracilis]|uniref:DUF2845 domain-containing protein n=1 Tax=Mucilaginibacter gracilis TaxID=423350 RepID=A0A495J1D1_9SPHI|nr:hypothetical protein [Mucilaginibacter gracilis]RKR82138.1 hypothetical protein BDD43_2306 [Mucilaginibacter gracilis]
MKKYFFSTLMLLLVMASVASAQTKIDKYCQVLVGNNNYTLYLKKSSAKISFGDRKELFAPKDTTIFQQLKKVNSLTTETDVLNYMSQLGWSVVNIHAITNKWEVIYFKKEFDRSEFAQ